MTDAKTSTQVATIPVPAGGERTRHIRRGGGQDVGQRGRGAGLPDLAGRSGRPGTPGLVRVPPGPLTAARFERTHGQTRQRRTGAHEPGRLCPAGRPRLGRSGRLRSGRRAGPVPGAAGRGPGGAVGARWFAGKCPDGAGCPLGPGPEPHDDGGQPRPHGRLRPAPGLPAGPAPVPGILAGRGDRRSASRPAAVGGRTGAAAGPGAARLPGRTARRRRDRDSVHDLRRHPGPDLRLGALLRPVGADRDRRRRARLRGRRADRRGLGDRRLPPHHGRRWLPALSRRASS